MTNVITRERILSQLEKILSANEFSSAPRQQSFLRFIVMEHLAGQDGEIKETRIAAEVYGRAVDYDPRIDSVVRVEASKLRQRLKNYYDGPGKGESLRISIPKGSYKPHFEELLSEPATTTPMRGWNSPLARWMAIGIVLLATAGLGFWWAERTASSLDPTRMKLTRFSDMASYSKSPAVSRDGRFAVFASSSPESQTLDLWRQPMNGGAALALTQSNLSHDMPTISLDGNTLVFRVESEGGYLGRMPATGGTSVPLRNTKGARDPRFSPVGMALLFWVPTDEQTKDYGKVFIASLEATPDVQPIRLFGDFAHAAIPIWSETGSHVVALGTWQSGIPEKEFDAWILELDGFHAKATPKKTGLFDALRKAGLHPALSARSRIEVADWMNNWLYLTLPIGESIDIFRIRLNPKYGMVEGNFERVTFGAGIIRGPRLAPDGSLVFTRQESSNGLYSLAVPPKGMAAVDLRLSAEETGEIIRPAVHTSGTLGVWEKRGGPSDEKPWFFDLRSGKRTQLGADLSFLCSHAIISPDGRSAAFRADQTNLQPIYLQAVEGGTSRRICDNCGTPSDWTADGRHILYVTGGKPASIGFLDILTGASGDRIQHPSYNLFGARARMDSSGDGWVVFYGDNGIQTRQVLLAQIHNYNAGAPSEWIPLTDGAHWDQSPAWAADSRTIYFVRRQDGLASIWARSVDPQTGRPTSPIWNVQDFRTQRQTLMISSNRRGSEALWVAGNRIFFTLDNRRSNLYKINVLRQSN